MLSMSKRTVLAVFNRVIILQLDVLKPSRQNGRERTRKSELGEAAQRNIWRESLCYFAS